MRFRVSVAINNHISRRAGTLGSHANTKTAADYRSKSRFKTSGSWSYEPKFINSYNRVVVSCRYEVYEDFFNGVDEAWSWVKRKILKGLHPSRAPVLIYWEF